MRECLTFLKEKDGSKILCTQERERQHKSFGHMHLALTCHRPTAQILRERGGNGWWGYGCRTHVLRHIFLYEQDMFTALAIQRLDFAMSVRAQQLS
jgi:hypothetical protein